MSFFGLTDILRGYVSKHRPRVEGLDAAWVIDGKLLQMSTPGAGLSSLWRNPEEEVLKYLQKNCVKYIIKCNQTCRYNISLFENAGISVSDINWPDHTTPTLDQAVLLVTFLWQIFQSGACAIHCTAGIGRSGITSVAFLVFLGYGADESIVWVRKRRPGSVQNDHQVQFCREFEQYILDNPILVHHMRAAAFVPPSNIEAVREYFIRLYESNTQFPLYRGHVQALRDKIHWDAVTATGIDSVRLANISDLDPSLTYLQHFMDGGDQSEYVGVGDGDQSEDHGSARSSVDSPVIATAGHHRRGTSDSIFILRGFGQAIPDELAARENAMVQVPLIVQRLTRELIRSDSPPGLFHVQPSVESLLSTQEHLIKSNRATRRADMLLACGHLLLSYFRSLPQGLFTVELRTRALAHCSEEVACVEVLGDMDAPHRATLLHMINFFSVIAHRSPQAHHLRLTNLATLFAGPMLGLESTQPTPADVIAATPLCCIEKSGWNSFRMPVDESRVRPSGQRRHTGGDTMPPPGEAVLALPNQADVVTTHARKRSHETSTVPGPSRLTPSDTEFHQQRERFQSSPAHLHGIDECGEGEGDDCDPNSGPTVAPEDVQLQWPADSLGRAAGFLHTLCALHSKERWLSSSSDYHSSLGIPNPMQVESDLKLPRAARNGSLGQPSSQI